MTAEDIRRLSLRGALPKVALFVISEELELADKARDTQCDNKNCVGENHVMDCAAEIAKQDYWSAQDKRRTM